MTTRVYIPIPQEFDDENSDFELKPYLQRFVEGELAQALDTDVWELDDRAHAYDTEITDVEIHGDNLNITYNVLFDAYYGCKDQNYAGQDERFLTGTRIGAHWVFEQYVPRQRRSTYDEF
jgi:hypothetical protein